MSFAFLSEEDRLFRDTVRSWVDAEIPKDWCRELEREEDAFPHAFWDKLSSFGAHGIGIPEEYGGQGGSIVTQVLFARELARTAAGVGWVWGVTSFSGGKGVLGEDLCPDELVVPVLTLTLRTGRSERGG